VKKKKKEKTNTSELERWRESQPISNCIRLKMLPEGMGGKIGCCPNRKKMEVEYRPEKETRSVISSDRGGKVRRTYVSQGEKKKGEEEERLVSA